MDKDLDYEIYNDIADAWNLEDDQMHKRKVIYSRIIKPSSDKSKDAYKILGLVLPRLGQAPKSIFPLKKLTIIEPYDARIRIELAEVLLYLEKYNECLDFLKKALVFCPGEPLLHRVLIEALERNQRLEELQDFTKDIANMIADSKARQKLYILTAEVLSKNNKYTQARMSYQKAVENNPIMEENFHYNYGLALYHEGLLEEAIVQFEHCWKLNPNKKRAINNIAYMNYCLGKVEKALEGFEEIIKNGLEENYTYSNYLVVLYHFDKDEEVIKKCQDLLKPVLQFYRVVLLQLYEDELRKTQAILQKNDIVEKTKEFNAKKIMALNQVLSFIN